MAVDFSKKQLVFITGASRGIGRGLALGIARITNPKSTLVLLASSQKGLDETASLLAKLNSSIKTVTYAIDLSNPSFANYQKLFEELLKDIDLTELNDSIFIHNAGSVGSMKNCLELTDEEVWRKFYDLNMISTVALNTNFVKKTRNLAKRLIVVNITSMLGVIPFPNMAMYGSGKAARNLFFKVFAVEEPNILVLSYSPGPVKTDMLEQVSGTLKKQFEETKKQAITTEETVRKLLSILKAGDYKSGDFIDFYERYFTQ